MIVEFESVFNVAEVKTVIDIFIVWNSLQLQILFDQAFAYLHLPIKYTDLRARDCFFVLFDRFFRL